MAWQDVLVTGLERHLGERLPGLKHSPSAGGCINDTLQLGAADGRRWFVKINRQELADMFAAEAAGLDEIAGSASLRVPRPLFRDGADGRCWLVLEYLPLGGPARPERLGRQLAAMHRHRGQRFGWWRDNTIGSTPQPNGACDDWVAFLRQRRLGFQLRLARDNGIGSDVLRAGEALLDDLPAFFTDHRPAPSLLHGDLWGGNHGYITDGTPVIFDPAVYYGDREADLAMTELFGGYPEAFYAAYREAWPVDPGYAVRRRLYNLYHVLNHFNLFGGGYGSQAGQMIRQLRAELG